MHVSSLFFLNVSWVAGVEWGCFVQGRAVAKFQCNCLRNSHLAEIRSFMLVEVEAWTANLVERCPNPPCPISDTSIPDLFQLTPSLFISGTSLLFALVGLHAASLRLFIPQIFALEKTSSYQARSPLCLLDTTSSFLAAYCEGYEYTTYMSRAQHYHKAGASCLDAQQFLRNKFHPPMHSGGLWTPSFKRPPQSKLSSNYLNPPFQVRPFRMYQQRQSPGNGGGQATDDGMLHGPPPMQEFISAQQPTHITHQGARVYCTPTTVATGKQPVGHNDDTRGAYAIPSHSPYQSTPQQPLDSWGQHVLEPRGVYPFQVAQKFGFQGGHIYHALPPSSQPYTTGMASYSPGVAIHETWPAPGPRRLSYPNYLPETTGSLWQQTSGQPLTYPNPVPYPPPSPPHISPSSATSDTYTEPPPVTHGKNFIQESFPGDDSGSERLRAALTEVMNAPWKCQHQPEPDEDVLLQFHQYRKSEGRWHCRFSKDGKLCNCKTRKKDHAKGHIRWHIDHRPYYCQNPW